MSLIEQKKEIHLVSDGQKTRGKEEPAVNRLLNILRSQTPEEDYSNEPEQPEEQDLSQDDQENSNLANDSDSAEMASSILNRLKEIEDNPDQNPDVTSEEIKDDPAVEENKDDPVSSNILVKNLQDKIEEDTEDHAEQDPVDEPVEPASDETETAQEDDQEDSSLIIDEPEEIPVDDNDDEPDPDEDIFPNQEQERTQRVQDEILKTKSGEEIVEPPAFDTSLYSNYDFGESARSFDDYLYAFLNIFNESTRKLAFHVGTKRLRFLMVKTGIGENIIEKVGIYSLPYKVPDSHIVIKDMNELITYILDNELSEQERKIAYGALYNNSNKPKSIVFQIPQLKGKEAKDLIAWQIKKNLPGGSDQILAHEIGPYPGDSKKKNIVVGAGDRATIRRDILPFRKKKIKLRLNSTASILMWKLFIHHYPDKRDGTYILIHIGEKSTSMVVVRDHQLIFIRDISIGVEDLYKSVQQRIVVGNNAIEVDAVTAERLFREYGVPENTQGLAGDTGVSLYKLSILMRPTIERLTGELTRSISFFRKENPDADPLEMIFSGTGSSFPNLVKTLGGSMDIPVSLLNPMRVSKYTIAENVKLDPKDYPDLDLNFALTLNQSSKINILPDYIVNNFKFIFPMKLSMGLAAFFIPFFIGTSILSNVQISRQKRILAERQSEWDKLQEQLGDYTYMINDIKYLSGFQTYLENDFIHSENAIKILKVTSEIFPDGFKVQDMKLGEETSEEYLSAGGKFKNYVEYTGFLQADQSVSSIHFTNFILKIESLPFEHEIEYETRNDSDARLNYTIKLRY